MLLPIFLRREPTTDGILLRYVPGAKRSDVVAYRDRECLKPIARWSWYLTRPDRRFKRVMLNCYQWRAVWLPDLPSASPA